MSHNLFLTQQITPENKIRCYDCTIDHLLSCNSISTGSFAYSGVDGMLRVASGAVTSVSPANSVFQTFDPMNVIGAANPYTLYLAFDPTTLTLDNLQRLTVNPADPNPPTNLKTLFLNSTTTGWEGLQMQFKAVTNTTANTNILGVTYSSSASKAEQFFLARARGTESAPLGVQTGDFVSDTEVLAYESTAQQFNVVYEDLIQTVTVSPNHVGVTRTVSQSIGDQDSQTIFTTDGLTGVTTYQFPLTVNNTFSCNSFGTSSVSLSTSTYVTGSNNTSNRFGSLIDISITCTLGALLKGNIIPIGTIGNPPTGQSVVNMVSAVFDGSTTDIGVCTIATNGAITFVSLNSDAVTNCIVSIHSMYTI